MRSLSLPAPEGYDLPDQRTVVYMAAQLNDQTQLLKESVRGLQPAALEWQPAPGLNTIGMLLAHMAVAEAWWMNAGVRGIADRDRVEAIVHGVIGIDPADDGMPIAPDGTHPDTLRGRTLDDYLALLAKARAATHAVLREWSDADLDRTVQLREQDIALEWILYHVLEHFSVHYGQILLMRHLLRDEGLLKSTGIP
jgi:uncharacterized damage-inducible protein DinB